MTRMNVYAWRRRLWTKSRVMTMIVILLIVYISPMSLFQSLMGDTEKDKERDEGIKQEEELRDNKLKQGRGMEHDNYGVRKKGHRKDPTKREISRAIDGILLFEEETERGGKNAKNPITAHEEDNDNEGITEKAKENIDKAEERGNYEKLPENYELDLQLMEKLQNLENERDGEKGQIAKEGGRQGEKPITKEQEEEIIKKELVESEERERKIDEAIYNDINVKMRHSLKEKKIHERLERLMNPGNSSSGQMNPFAAEMPQNGSFPHNVLLLASMGRSGSSFLGGLLNSQSSVFYVFEPLHDLNEKHILNRQSAMNSLRGLFTCNITKEISSSFQRKPRFMIKQYYKECRTRRTCLTTEAMNAACARKAIRVVKTIRTRISWLEPLLNDTAANVKVIHLVRDPRASIISGWDRGWNLSANDSCDDLSQDIQNGLLLSRKYPGKYMAVRYEDLCDDPWGLARYIFNFLGYSALPNSTLSFLKSSTSGQSSSGAYSIRRNTKRMQQKWRSTIQETQLLKIEKGCSRIITQIGFNVFHSFQDARNVSVPLYNDKYVNKLFRYYDD